MTASILDIQTKLKYKAWLRLCRVAMAAKEDHGRYDWLPVVRESDAYKSMLRLLDHYDNSNIVVVPEPAGEYKLRLLNRGDDDDAFSAA